jgi:glycosyltransferase involved in cell wall biosynthesis
LARAYLGADADIFNPNLYRNIENPDGKFVVSFIGEFIPSQGVKYILDSAKFLENYPNIQLKLTGALPIPLEVAKKYIKRKQLSNVLLESYIPLEKVPRLIAESDIQLGIFGNTPKAQMVLSNKVVCAAAMGKPIITGYSKASAELFEHKRNIWFTDFANGKSIANSIIALYEDDHLRRNLGKEARTTFLENLIPKKVTQSIIDAFNHFKDEKRL